MYEKVYSDNYFYFIPIRYFSQEEKISEIIASIAEELADDENYPEAAELYSEKLYDLIDKACYDKFC